MNRNGYQYSYESEVEVLCYGLRNAIAKGGKPKTAKTAATRAYKFLRKKAAQYGMNPDCEVGISPPKSGHYPSKDDHVWWVTWESGPFEWAIAGSFAAMDGAGALVEPYYGFDLAFYETEFGDR